MNFYSNAFSAVMTYEICRKNLERVDIDLNSIVGIDNECVIDFDENNFISNETKNSSNTENKVKCNHGDALF